MCRAVNMAEEDTLKIYWDHFFKAETGTYEKSTWLDLFLAEFLIRVNEGANPKELIKFCPVSGVVSLVGCELLCGIHRVTSSVSALAAPPLPTRDAQCSAKTPAPDQVFASSLTEEEADDEKKEESRAQSTSLFTQCNAQSSAEILRQYLLGGVAWRCLELLRLLGVEGLSCCRQLSSVLIWLFGELGAVESPPANAKEHSPTTILKSKTKTPIHQLFSRKIEIKKTGWLIKDYV
ncbi:uncharacterized protein LOC113225883 isoform X2 [Hyposmocoma kahamanoa]|uniref:uncharacterized protein LOC113225883 isoform X2 n=1 Tax=Hyposmocoma kahamanoa TaxID=1477025 RepID=UPI000E6D651C|nr:uncharacterized protein LOC113225883 isoform X2 [Hyposmocoma kahamanoa]